MPLLLIFHDYRVLYPDKTFNERRLNNNGFNHNTISCFVDLIWNFDSGMAKSPQLPNSGLFDTCWSSAAFGRYLCILIDCLSV